MKKSVDVGTCYSDSAISWNRWQVARVYADSLGTPHAVVTSLSDPTVSRTIACQILNDRRRFRPIGDEEAQRHPPAIVAHPTAPEMDAILVREGVVAVA